MHRKRSSQPAAIILFSLLFTTITGFTQSIQIDSSSLNEVIHEWNYAHNARSRQSFTRVYDEQMIFYTEVTSRDNSIKAKERMFRVYPDYHQKIQSRVRHQAYASGIVKSEFTKRVTRGGKTNDLPSYLLISYTNNNYKIVGESDVDTDIKMDFTLAIGEPIQFTYRDSSKSLTTASLPMDEEEEDSIVRSVQSAFNDGVDEIQTLQSRLMEETVTIPKLYIYYLIGLLVIGGVFILFARAPVVLKKNKLKNKNKTTDDRVTDEAFDHFVFALFDPLYFKARKVKRAMAYASGSVEAERFPEYEIEFSQKDQQVKFAVDTLYLSGAENGQIPIASQQQIRAYHQFEVENDIDVYILLGLAGKPHDPKEVYLIPLKELNKQSFTYDELQQFRKHGMFFFNLQRRRLF